MRLTTACITLLCITVTGCASLEETDCCVNRSAPTQLTGDQVRILTLNVAHGRDESVNQLFVTASDFRDNLRDIAALIRQSTADVIALQEADEASRWSGGFDHVEFLMAEANLASSVHAPHAGSWLFSYGTAVLSPHAFSASHIQDFPPSFPTTRKGFTAATLNWLSADTETQLTVISVHLDFSRRSVRQEQAAELIGYVESLDGPVVIAGDFNGEWRDEDSAVRALADALQLQLYQPLAEGLGTYKEADGTRLDWILLSPELEFLSYKVYPDIVSDHLAVEADIRLKSLSACTGSPDTYC